MPTYGVSSHPQDLDPRGWERCRREVAATMVAAGWNPRAGRFNEVQMRKARRLFWSRR